MTANDGKVRQALAGLDTALIEAMLADGRILEVPAGTELLKEGAYVRELPLVSGNYSV